MANDLITTTAQTPSTPCLPASLKRLMTAQGRSTFSEDGEFLGTVEDWRPPAALPAAVLEEARTTLAAFEAALVPAEPHTLSGRVASALNHYFVPAAPANAGQASALQRAVAHDWHDALGEFPAWAVNEAFRRWVRREERRPTPAAIRAECQRLCADQLKTRDRLRRIVRDCAPATPHPNNVVPIPSLRRVQDA